MNKPTPTFYEVINKSTESKTVDVLIYGAVPQLDYDTYQIKNTAEKFVKDFMKLEQEYERINIKINSPGGSLYHAFPIFNVIANSKREIHTYNDGLAGSAAGVLLIAGKKIHSAKNAFLMIHRASGVNWGNATQMRDYAEILEKYEDVIAERFAEKSKMEKSTFIEKYFNGKDHFLTAQQAMDEGFLDIIEDYESEAAPPADIKNLAFSEVMAMYSPKEKEESFIAKITKHLRNTFNFSEKEDPQIVLQTNQLNPQSIDMNFEISNNLLAKDTLSAEDVTAIRAEVSAYRAAGEKFTPEEVQVRINNALVPIQQEVTLLATAKTELENQVSALTAEKSTLATDVQNLKNQNDGLSVTLEAYRKTGVKLDSSQNSRPDPIPGEDTVENFFSEADQEVKKLRENAGIPSK